MEDKDKVRELFDMYEGLEVKEEEVPLKLEKDAPEGVETELVDDDPSVLRPHYYEIHRSYHVPNGKYSVRMRAMTKSNPTYRGKWFLDAQGLLKYDSDFVPAHWEEKDSDWIEDVDVTDGTLRLAFTWSGYGCGNGRTGYIEWVEFQYKKVG